MSGPAGYGTSGFIASVATFPYRVEFENDPIATAPAQSVIIADQLDPNLDWNTFQLTEFGFGDNVFSIPPDCQHFQTTVPMTYNGQTFDVQIELGLHTDAGQVYAIFRSIDANTDLPPDVLTGFLPPEDGTGRGMGYFSYTIRPKPNLATGTQIRNAALITFDANPSIATDQLDENDASKGTDPSKEALVTIDGGPPTSQVTALPPSETSQQFTVQWSGSDDTGGSGIATYTIYVSDNGTDFVPWLQNTTLTQSSYTGLVGHTYAFISQAADNVGNVEALRTMADSQTTVVITQPTRFAVSVPAAATAGDSFTVTVTAEDDNRNITAGYTGTIHFTSSDLQALLPDDYTFTAGDAGVHSFTITLKTAGSQTITTADQSNSTVTGSATVSVAPVAASTLAVTGYPSPAVSGQLLSFNVIAYDHYGNVATGYSGKVQFTSTDAAAILPAVYTFAPGDAGVHTFNSTLETAGIRSLTATDQATSGITGTEAGIVVKPASFVVAGYPSSTVAGTSHTLTVTAKNADGATATGYTGTIHFTSDDAQAALPADYAFTAADAGVHNFTATLKTAGSRSLAVSDAAVASVTGTQSGITVNPAALSKLGVTGIPSQTTAGVACSVTVAAQDAYGNTVPGYLGTVKLTSTDTKATLPSIYTFTTTDNSAHTFTNGVTLKTAGIRTISATDSHTASIKGSETVTVNPGPAKTMGVAGFPSPITAGGSGSFTVTVKDAFSNVVTGYLGTVKFTSSDTKAVFPANYTFVASDVGIHTFTATLKTAGSKAITATDTVTSTITGKQTVTVNAAAISKFTVTASPTSTTAGNALSATVTAKDIYGNTVKPYLGTIHFTSTDSQAVLLPDYTFVAADAGVHVFTNGIILKTVGSGTQTITTTDTATSTITGTSGSIRVTAAAASHLKVTAVTTGTAGTAFNVTVTAQDPYGNTAISYVGTIHFTSSDAQAVLPANYTFTSTAKGIHTFTSGVNLKTAGTQTVTATDTVTNSITGLAGIAVQPAAATRLSITAPSSVAAGVAFTFTVTALDAYGNTATGYVGTVHFTSSDGQALLPANYKFVSGDQGVHTFKATLNTTGTQSLTATDTSTSTIKGSDPSITVAAAALDELFRGLAIDPDDETGDLDLIDDGCKQNDRFRSIAGLRNDSCAVAPAEYILSLETNELPWGGMLNDATLPPGDHYRLRGELVLNESGIAWTGKPRQATGAQPLGWLAALLISLERRPRGQGTSRRPASRHRPVIG
jgi:hypothetical protein